MMTGRSRCLDVTVGVQGLEPRTSAVCKQRSNQLSYTPEKIRARPLTARIKTVTEGIGGGKPLGSGDKTNAPVRSTEAYGPGGT